jgi:sugar-specific transcriptional regulator TrmB
LKLKKKSKRLEQLKGEDVLGELSSLYSNGVKFVEPSDLSGSLRGRQNLYNHMDMMIRSAEKSITLATSEEGLNRKLEVLMPALEKAKKRGVSIRIAAPINDSNIKVARELAKVADVRSVPAGKNAGRFTVVDGNELMFMLLDDKTVHPNYDVGVWLSTQYFAAVLEQMFEIAWNDFTPVTKLSLKAK